MGLGIRLVAVACVIAGAVAAPGAQQVFSPGDGVTLPSVVTQVRPEYTPEAKAARIEGAVVLDTVVLADGTVGDVVVAQSLDSTLGLDREAVKAMKQWRFKAGTKDGRAVAVRVQVSINFTLK